MILGSLHTVDLIQLVVIGGARNITLGMVLVLATLSGWARSITAAEVDRVLVLAMMCLDCVLATLCCQTRSIHGMGRVLVVSTLGRNCRLLTPCQQTCNI